MTEPLITEMLPADSTFYTILKVMFACNLICSFPITIYPTQMAIESFAFSSMRKNTTLRYWLKNLSRMIVTISVIMTGVMLADKIDKFLGCIGALFCAPLALTIPSILHLKLLAKTPKDKMFNIALIILSISVLFFSTYQTLSEW